MISRVLLKSSKLNFWSRNLEGILANQENEDPQDDYFDTPTSEVANEKVDVSLYSKFSINTNLEIFWLCYQ